MENIPVHFLASEERHLQNENAEMTLKEEQEQDWHLENINNESNIPETNANVELLRSEIRHENYGFNKEYVNVESENQNNVEITEDKHETAQSEVMSFSCTECDFSGNSNEMIKTHMTIHRTTVFLGDQCQYRAKFKSIIDKYPIIIKYVDEVNGNYLCTECNFQSILKFSIVVHICKHTDELIYACEECEFLGSSQLELDNHFTTHSTKETFVCSICDYNFQTYSALSTHFKTHSEKKSLACTMCGYTTDIKGSLKTHMLIHNSDEIYKCSECEYTSTRKQSFRNHMISHTGKYPYNCSVCGYKCKEKRNMNSHKLIHSGEKPFNCSLCEFKCRRKSRLAQHIKSHDKNHPCPVCKKLFSSASSVELHMAKHTGIKPFKCELCEFSTARKLYMKKHMLIKHSAIKPFLCTECGHTCSTEADLTRHVFSHTGERPYVCTLCDYTGTTEQNLKSHMLTHKSVKSIACSECDYTCSASKSLIAHMATHTGIKAFSCSVCDKRFTRKVLRNKHMLIHTGEKPYKCSYCGYQCRTSDRLKSHERTHTGEKPFNCTLCGYCCNDSGNFSKHMRNKHQGYKGEPAKKLFVPPKRIKDSSDGNLVAKLLVNTQDIVNKQEQFLFQKFNSHSHDREVKEGLLQRSKTIMQPQLQSNNSNATKETHITKEHAITKVSPVPKQISNTSEVQVPDIEIKQSVEKLIVKASPKVKKILKIASNSIESLEPVGTPRNPDTLDKYLKYQNEILQCVNIDEKKKYNDNMKKISDNMSHKETDQLSATSSLATNKKNTYRNVEALVAKSTHFMSEESQSPVHANGVSFKNVENTKHSPFSINHGTSGTQLPSQFRNSLSVSHTAENSNSQLYNQASFNSPYFNSLFHSQHLNSAVNRNLNQNLFYPNSPHYNPTIYNNHEPSFTNQSEQM